MRNISEVICLWKWVDKNWELVESYPSDDNGHPITKPKNVSGNRHSAHEWCHNSKTETDHMGRAIMTWSMEHGVSFVRYNPPKWNDWFSPMMDDVLKKEWMRMLERSYTLLEGTSKAAYEWLVKEIKNES